MEFLKTKTLNQNHSFTIEHGARQNYHAAFAETEKSKCFAVVSLMFCYRVESRLHNEKKSFVQSESL